MTALNIEQAQSRLPQLILELIPGQALVITQNGTPVATLARTPRQHWPCHAGSARSLPHWIAPDFDAPLDDFRDYTQ